MLKHDNFIGASDVDKGNSVHSHPGLHDHDAPLDPEFIRELNINTHELDLLLFSYSFAAAIAGVFATYLVERLSEIYSYR